MNKYGEITLISRTYAVDSIGQDVGTNATQRTIPCKVESIGRNEWITANQAGYEADIKATVFSASYNGESIAQYDSKTYEIYRTYQVGDELELYLGTRVGEIDAQTTTA